MEQIKGAKSAATTGEAAAGNTKFSDISPLQHLHIFRVKKEKHLNMSARVDGIMVCSCWRAQLHVREEIKLSAHSPETHLNVYVH